MTFSLYKRTEEPEQVRPYVDAGSHDSSGLQPAVLLFCRATRPRSRVASRARRWLSCPPWTPAAAPCPEPTAVRLPEMTFPTTVRGGSPRMHSRGLCDGRRPASFPASLPVQRTLPLTEAACLQHFFCVAVFRWYRVADVDVLRHMCRAEAEARAAFRRGRGAGALLRG